MILLHITHSFVNKTHVTKLKLIVISKILQTAMRLIVQNGYVVNNYLIIIHFKCSTIVAFVQKQLRLIIIVIQSVYSCGKKLLRISTPTPILHRVILKCLS